MLDHDEIQEALNALKQADGNKTAAAEIMNMTRSRLRRLLIKAAAQPEDTGELVDDLPDYQQVKKRLAGYNQKYIDDFYKERHLSLRVPHAPFMQMFIGDPHRDSPGHDDVKFEADLDLMRRAQEEFTCHLIQMGDILDHWPTSGKLAKKHHDSHLTRKESLALVKGFAREEGLDFALWLIGNHDQWPGVDFEVLLRQWLTCPLVDWAAQITVTTPKGFIFRTLAAHDMPGSSINSSVYALARRAREDGGCDLYVAGHRHKGGQAKEPNGHRGRTYSMMRVKGYKLADEYAWAKGFPEEEEGATGLAVINPLARTQDSVCRTFYDLEEGLDWARFLTSRAA